MECPEAVDAINAGDTVSVDFDTGVITDEKGSAWNTLPLVSSVMTPVSKSTLTVSPALMASTASGHSMMGRCV